MLLHRDSGAAITAKYRGRVEHVESKEILVRRLVEENGTEHEGELDRYPLAKFKRSNTGTCYKPTSNCFSWRCR